MRSRRSVAAAFLLTAVAALAAGATDAAAQVAKMTGVVVDDEGNPLKGVKVYVKDVATNNVVRPAVTTTKGRFTYTSLPPAKYVLWPELEGYVTARLVVTLTGAKGDKSVQHYFFDAKQEFDKAIRVNATGDIGTLVRNEFEFTMTTPDKHTAVTNKLYAEYRGTEEGEGGEAEKAPPAAAPAEKTNLDKGMDQIANANYAAAIPFLTLAADEVKDAKDQIEVQYQLGKASVEVGNMDAAETHLKKVQEMDPTRPGTSFYLARIYNEKGMKQEALAEMEREAALSPDSEAVLQNLATLYIETAQQARAIETLESLIEMNPESFEAYQSLARIHKDAGDRKKEAEVYQRMGDKDPSGQSLYNLGNLAFNQDDREKAKFYYERVIEKNPKHAMAHYQLAYTLIGLGDISGAVSHLETFAKLSPKDPKAAEAIETAKALKGTL
jgi:tetratricopeptide (TPR) repeat protein